MQFVREITVYTGLSFSFISFVFETHLIMHAFKDIKRDSNEDACEAEEEHERDMLDESDDGHAECESDENGDECTICDFHFICSP